MNSPFYDQTAAFGDLIAYRSTESSPHQPAATPGNPKAALPSLAWQRLTKNEALHAVRMGRPGAGNPLFINFRQTSPKKGSAKRMPQIWMTYHEIASMLGCDVETARAATIQRTLDRKKSRDGMTRAKLDPELMGRFIAAIRHADPALDQAVRDLRNMHETMLRNDQAGTRLTPIHNNPGRTAAG